MTIQEVYNRREKMFSDFRGCALKSYNYFHWGYKDKQIYEAGFIAELREVGYQIFHKHEFPIFYKNRPSEISILLDLVVSDELLGGTIIQFNVSDQIDEESRKNLWAGMKLTNLEYGMIVNIGESGITTENWMRNNPMNDHCVKIEI